MTKADILARIDRILGPPEFWVERVAQWRRDQLERLQLDLEIDLRREREEQTVEGGACLTIG